MPFHSLSHEIIFVSQTTNTEIAFEEVIHALIDTFRVVKHLTHSIDNKDDGVHQTRTAE